MRRGEGGDRPDNAGRSNSAEQRSCVQRRVRAAALGTAAGMGTWAGIPPWNRPPPPQGMAWRAMPEFPQSTPWAGGRGGWGGSLQARLRPATGHGRWNCPCACLGRWGHKTKVPRGAFLGVRSLSLLGPGLLYPLDEVEVQGSSGQSVVYPSVHSFSYLWFPQAVSSHRWRDGKGCIGIRGPLSTSPPSLLSTKSRGPQLPDPSLGSGPGGQLPAALHGVLSWKTTWGSPPGLPHAPAWRWADLGLWNLAKEVLSAMVWLCGFSERGPSLLGCGWRCCQLCPRAWRSSPISGHALRHPSQP